MPTFKEMLTGPKYPSRSEELRQNLRYIQKQRTSAQQKDMGDTGRSEMEAESRYAAYRKSPVGKRKKARSSGR